MLSLIRLFAGKLSALHMFFVGLLILPMTAFSQGIGDRLKESTEENAGPVVSAILIIAGAGGVIAVLWGVYTVFFAKRNNPQAPVGWGMVALIGGPVLMSIPVFTGVLAETFLGADGAGDAAEHLDLDLGSVQQEYRLAAVPQPIADTSRIG